MMEFFCKNFQFILTIWHGLNVFELGDVLLQRRLIKFDQGIWVLRIFYKIYG